MNINFLRKHFTTVPFFYRIYFNLNVKKRQKGKKLHDSLNLDSILDYYLDGYERSGNTYTKSLMKELFPDYKSLSHLHKIAPLKIMCGKDIPVFVLVRNPLEAVSSNYLKHFSRGVLPPKIDIRILRYRLDDWVSYYSWVNKNLENINIIRFEDLISDTLREVKNIYKVLNIACPEDLLGKIANLDEAFKSGGGAQEEYGRGIPTIQKEEKKARLKTEISKELAYLKASALYKEISVKLGKI